MGEALEAAAAQHQLEFGTTHACSRFRSILTYLSAPTFVLGISAFYHDSAVALLRDGDIIAAASEERFTRIKGDAAFPSRALEWCLRDAGIGLTDLSAVAYYEKPLLKFERILETYLGVAPRGFGSFLKAGPLWIKEKLYQDRTLRESLGGWN